MPFTGLLAGLALAAIYAPVFADLGRIWWTDPYAGHGMFVPLLTALFLWRGREELRAAAGPGRPAGLLVILAGLGLMAMSRSVTRAGCRYMRRIHGIAVSESASSWSPRAPLPGRSRP